MRAPAAEYLSVKRTKIIATLLLTFAVSSGSVAIAPPAQAYVAPGESTLWRLTNQARARHRLAPVRLNSSLSYTARRHSAAMATRGSLYHTRNLAYAVRSFSWSIAGENVGVGPTIEKINRAFILSTPHRANILNRRFKTVGVGVVWRSGKAWVTVIFIG